MNWLFAIIVWIVIVAVIFVFNYEANNSNDDEY
jgi:hypothetical protein